MEKIHYRLPIYSFQIDFMHHVSNIIYVEWMEIGRSLLLEKADLALATIEKAGYGPVLVETQIQYQKPLVLGDEVYGAIWISELANASAWMDFTFHNGSGELAAHGRQRGLFIEFASGRPKRITPAERKAFEAFLIPGKSAL